MKLAPTQPSTARYQPLVIIFMSAAAGVAADRCWPLAAPLWWWLALLALAAWWLAWRGGRRKSLAPVLLMIATAATGASWHHVNWFLGGDDDLGVYAREAAQPVCVEVIALESPRGFPAPPFDPLRAIPFGERSEMEVRVVALRDGEPWRPVSGRASCLVQGGLPSVSAGDRLRVFARLSAPPRAANAGEFDYARHARADGVHAQLIAGYPECVTTITTGGDASLRGAVETIRSAAVARLRHYLSRDRSPLAAALILGDRQALDADRTEAFFRTGTIHLLAISGLHVGILAGALLSLLRFGFIPRGPLLAGVAMVIVVYALVTDARPPVLRAAILVLLTCAAIWLGRRPLSFNALAAAAMLVLLWNPADLFRTGAQLSFLAVATIAYVGPRYTRWQALDPLARLIARTRPAPVRLIRQAAASYRTMLLLSLAIWLMTAPLVAARFHIVAPAGILLGPVLWIPVALALLAGFGVFVFGFWLPPAATICGWACDANLWLLEEGVRLGLKIPGGHFWAPGPSPWWLLGFYGGLALLAAAPSWRPPPRWCVALLAAWVTVGFAPAALRASQQDQLTCTFLSVGHGSAVVLQLPGGQTMLYDAGSLGSPERAARAISGHLWSRGVMHLDAVVLSHADVDHYNALPEVLERFSVGAIYVSPVMFENRTPALVKLAEAIERSGARLEVVHGGDRFRTPGDYSIEVLHPPRRGMLGSDNANSVVLAIEYAGRRILLPGDLETPGLEAVLAESPWDCDLLMAPHHGSRLSNPPGFAEWSRPEWVVISGRPSDAVTEIATAYRDRGARVLHAAEAGAVTVAIRPGVPVGWGVPGRLEVTTHHEGPAP